MNINRDIKAEAMSPVIYRRRHNEAAMRKKLCTAQSIAAPRDSPNIIRERVPRIKGEISCWCNIAFHINV